MTELNLKNRKIIAVIGQGKQCSADLIRQAEEVGREIARQNAVLICGGLKGVMEAACRGAKEKNGLTIGIIPGTQKLNANVFVDIVIATGLGEARNSIIARTADVLIAVGGRYGTLSEISFGLAFRKPVIGLDTWQNIEGVRYVNSPKEAVASALSLC